jgi:hypothetical protein
MDRLLKGAAGIVALLSVGLWVLVASRLRLPYDDADRYFDGAVVYDRYAILVYAALAAMATGGAALLWLVSRRSR